MLEQQQQQQYSRKSGRRLLGKEEKEGKARTLVFVIHNKKDKQVVEGHTPETHIHTLVFNVFDFWLFISSWVFHIASMSWSSVER
jgi:hypothetical protein